MTLFRHLEEACASLRLNKTRSALTAIGVIVGTAGIVVLGSASAGANARIEQQIGKMGANNLFVWTNGADSVRRGGPPVILTDEDATAIFEQTAGVRYLSRVIMGRADLVAGAKQAKGSFRGVDAAFADVSDFEVSEGRFFTQDELDSQAKVVVLGSTIASKLFAGDSPLDRTLRMQGIPLRIVGVRTRVGSTFGENQDDLVYVPISVARSRLPREGEASARHVDYIHLTVKSGDERGAVSDAILALLRERKHVRQGAKAPFEVFDATQAVELANETQATLNSLLVAMTVISLVAGGTGIMNIMLVSVTERTREIGLRRAVGARRRDILGQFLGEAILLCSLAGVAGMVLGVAGAYVVAAMSGWPVSLTAATLAIAFGVAAGIGIVFGYLPARRAAVLNPTEALRWE
jgi:putative ABC transport system permease protein